MTKLPDPESLAPQHIADEDLLAYLDGELSGEAHHEASQHLERCWDCRTKLAATQSRIESFMAIRQRASSEALVPADRAIAVFRQRLMQHAAESARQHHAPGSLARMARMPARPAFAVLGAAVFASILLVAWLNAPLSADEVLAKAEAHDLSAGRRSNAVVKSIIHIDAVDSKTGKRTRLNVLSTLADSATPAMSIAVGAPDGTVEEDVLASDHQVLVSVTSRIRFGAALTRYAVDRHWVPGISVAEYRKLIADRGADQAFVERANGAVVLRHPFRPGHPSGVLETRLQLDARTWMPTELAILTLENGVEQEYLLTRTGIEFLVRTQELAARFASAARRSAGPAEEPEPAAIPRRRPLPLSYSDSMASAAEVDVAVALHRINADLGEEINVFQMSDGSLLVQGLLDRAARKQQIEAALGSVSGIRVELYAATERRAAAADLFEPPWRSSVASGFVEPPSEAPQVRVADFTGATVPMYARLRAHFTERAGGTADADQVDAAIASYVSAVLERSSAALFHAWALRKLDLQFSERRVQQLTAASLSEIEHLRRAHRDGIAAAVRELAARLDEALPPGADDDATNSAPGADESTHGDVLPLASVQNQLVRALFTASAASSEPAAALARLRTVLRHLESRS